MGAEKIFGNQMPVVIAPEFLVFARFRLSLAAS